MVRLPRTDSVAGVRALLLARPLRTSATQRLALIWLLLGASLCLAGITGGVPALLGKVLLDPFLHSTSVANLFLLGGALLVCSIGVVWFSPPALSPPLAAFPCVIAATLGLWMFLQTLPNPGLTTAAVYQVGPDTLGYNQLFHSHSAKAGVALLANATDLNFAGFDQGRAYLESAPRILAGLSVVLAVVGGVALLWQAAALSQRFAAQPGRAFAGVLAAVHVAKASLDGGLLSYPFLLSVTVFLLLAWPAAGHRIRLALVLANLGYLVLWLSAGPTVPWRTLQSYLALGALYACLITWRPRQSGWRKSAGVWLAVYLVLIIWHEAERGIGALVQPLPPGAVLVGPGGVVQGDSADQTLARRLERLGEDPLKPRLHLIAIPAPGEPALRRLRMRIDPQQLAAPVAVERLLHSLAEQGYRARVQGFERYLRFDLEVVATLPPFHGGLSGQLAKHNHWVHLHRIAAALRSGGLDRFVMMPQRYG